MPRKNSQRHFQNSKKYSLLHVELVAYESGRNESFDRSVHWVLANGKRLKSEIQGFISRESLVIYLNII